MNNNLTPIECRDGIFFKRDDLFTYHNVNGGKVRSALKLTENITTGLVTAGSRKSPQIQIISEIAKYKNLPFIATTPNGKLTPELIYAQNNGAIINQIYMGFNNNLIKKAKEKAIETGYSYIPFGMDSEIVFDGISEQVQNIPMDCNRIIVTVGSGITLIGILKGLERYNIDKKVTGIVIGSNPKKRLDKYFPSWQNKCTLIKCNIDYHSEVKNNLFCGIELDSIYEAKCIPFVQKNDLFWIIGKGIRS